VDHSTARLHFGLNLNHELQSLGGRGTFCADSIPGAMMKRFRECVAAPIGLTMAAWAFCAALAGCSLPRTVMSAFDSPLNVGAPVQTSPGNFTLTADDASAEVANAAALQQSVTTCQALGGMNRTVDTSAYANNGRHFFTVNFQCQ